MTSEAERQDQDDSISMFRTVGGLVVVVLLIVFVAVNLDDVEIDFVVFSVHTKMLVAMLISALLGGAATLLFSGHGILGIGRRRGDRH